MSIKLSHLAQQDLDEIRRYTVGTWGRDQWHKYYRGLVGVFERIVQYPQKGRKRDLFYEGMLSVNFEKHVIFYKSISANNDEPVILRIIHQKRNMPALLYYEDLDS